MSVEQARNTAHEHNTAVAKGENPHDKRRTVSPACAYHGFSLELTEKELASIKTHAQRMNDDAEYAADVNKASNGEVKKVFIASLSEAIAMSPARFQHPHEFEAIVLLAKQLKQQQAVLSRP